VRSDSFKTEEKTRCADGIAERGRILELAADDEAPHQCTNWDVQTSGGRKTTNDVEWTP
jgi:hypothetical protein